MVIRTSSMLLRRIKDIRKTEGFISLIKRLVVYLTRSLIHSFLLYRNYYLYEHPIGSYNHNEADFMPRMQNFTLEIISSNQQASELAANGFEDLRIRFLNARRRLDRGAIAFCIFQRFELAHIGWVFMTEKIKSAIGAPPYLVRFSDNQACTGGSLTLPKYRGKGLMTYGYFKRLEYLRKQGFTSSRGSVNTSNIAAQKVHAKFGPTIYARARHVKVLLWQYWKEVPIEQTEEGN